MGPAVGTHPHGTASRAGSDGELRGAVPLGGDGKQRSVCAGALPLKQSRGPERGGGGGGRGARRLGSAAAAAGGGRRRGGERSPAQPPAPGYAGERERNAEEGGERRRAGRGSPAEPSRAAEDAPSPGEPSPAAARRVPPGRRPSPRR